MDAITTTALINLAAKFDNGDPAVTYDQYDEAMFLLVERQAEGDAEADAYLASLG